MQDQIAEYVIENQNRVKKLIIFNTEKDNQPSEKLKLLHPEIIFSIENRTFRIP